MPHYDSPEYKAELAEMRAKQDKKKLDCYEYLAMLASCNESKLPTMGGYRLGRNDAIAKAFYSYKADVEKLGRDFIKKVS